MSIKLSRSGLLVAEDLPLRALLEFPDTLLRGVGQVMLQDNAYAGLLFLIGIFFNSVLFGFAVALGATVSTATAILLGADKALVRAGMYGFNGALVAVALLYFLRPDALTWVCVIFASGTSSIVMAARQTLLKTWKIPALTAPFVFTSLCFFLAIARFGRLHSTHLLPTAGLPSSATVEGVVDASTLMQGLFNGVAQVFFQGSVLTGVIFVAGLAISSRVACATALAGSLTGLLVAWGMGAAETAIRSGAFGFNSVLTAIALGSVFLAPTIGSLAYGAIAVVTTSFVYAAISAALEPLGMPALTLPFVLVVWSFMLAAPGFFRTPLRASA